MNQIINIYDFRMKKVQNDSYSMNFEKIQVTSNFLFTFSYFSFNSDC